jgi:hypothetical protein
MMVEQRVRCCRCDHEVAAPKLRRILCIACHIRNPSTINIKHIATCRRGVKALVQQCSFTEILGPASYVNKHCCTTACTARGPTATSFSFTTDEGFGPRRGRGAATPNLSDAHLTRLPLISVGYIPADSSRGCDVEIYATASGAGRCLPRSMNTQRQQPEIDKTQFSISDISGRIRPLQEEWYLCDVDAC